LSVPDLGTFLLVHGETFPHTSAKPIAIERIFEVGVFSIKRFLWSSPNPLKNAKIPKPNPQMRAMNALTPSPLDISQSKTVSASFS
jgi:hypothetical protein